LDVPDRTTGPERGRVHPDRPQIERVVPRKPSVAGRIFRRNRGRNAGRLSAAELGRPRHLGTHSPARPRGGPHARGVPSRRVGGLVHDRLLRLDPVKDMKTIWPYSALLTNLFGILPPVFYPLSQVPIEWPSLVLLVPTSAGGMLVNAAAGLEPVTRQEGTVAAVALAAEAVILFVFGIYWARRMARER